jgi:hypothetical protein
MDARNPTLVSGAGLNLPGWDGQTVRLSMTGVPKRNSPFSVWSLLVSFRPSCCWASRRALCGGWTMPKEEDLAQSQLGAAVLGRTAKQRRHSLT